MTRPSPFHLRLFSWPPAPPSQAVDSQDLGSHRPAMVEAIMRALLRSKLTSWFTCLPRVSTPRCFSTPMRKQGTFWKNGKFCISI